MSMSASADFSEKVQGNKEGGQLNLNNQTGKSLKSKWSESNFSKMVSTLLYHKKNCCND